ncbi:MAG TPA: hypothetical protein VH561_00140 [Micromonosporaceae bacterium]|jgi:hypothetical protein
MDRETSWAEYNLYVLVDSQVHRPDPSRTGKAICDAAIPLNAPVACRPSRKAQGCRVCFEKLRRLRVAEARRRATSYLLVAAEADRAEENPDARTAEIAAFRQERQREARVRAARREREMADLADRRRGQGSSVRTSSAGLPTLGKRHR